MPTDITATLELFNELSKPFIDDGILNELYYHADADTLDQRLSVVSYALRENSMPLLTSEKQKGDYLNQLEDKYVLRILGEQHRERLAREQ